MRGSAMVLVFILMALIKLSQPLLQSHESWYTENSTITHRLRVLNLMRMKYLVRSKLLQFDRAQIMFTYWRIHCKHCTCVCPAPRSPSRICPHLVPQTFRFTHLPHPAPPTLPPFLLAATLIPSTLCTSSSVAHRSKSHLNCGFHLCRMTHFCDISVLGFYNLIPSTSIS